MIIALQGTPGSGKTTAIRQLTERQPSHISPIQEIIGFIPADASPNDYLANDVQKWQSAVRSTSEHVIIDRDFTSTLAYNATNSGFDSSLYQKLKTELNTCITKGELGLPSHIFRFYLPGEVSIRQQSPDNQESLRDLTFLERYELALDTVILEYYRKDQVTYVMLQDLPQDVIIKIEDRLNREENIL